MALHFVKYQATGNDFIAVADPQGRWAAQPVDWWAQLCHRRLGIGADGVLLLRPNPQPGMAYGLTYLNADGRPGSFCGNGARAAFAFARRLGWAGVQASFLAYDGEHTAWLTPQGPAVTLNVPNPLEARPQGQAFVDTGSPHHLLAVPEGLAQLDLPALAQPIRHGAAYANAGGTNVTLLQGPVPAGTPIAIRTYERGVEAETLSCGTGAVAAALFAHHQWGHPWPIALHPPGGPLVVAPGPTPQQLVLCGPARAVFAGQHLGLAP